MVSEISMSELQRNWEDEESQPVSSNVSLHRLVLDMLVSARDVRRLLLTLATFLLRSATYSFW